MALSSLFLFVHLQSIYICRLYLLYRSFLIVKGWVDNNKLLKKTGILSFSIIAAALTTITLYQKNISGTAAYITEPTRGFFPENIFSLFPLIPASFINPDTVSQLMNQQSDINTV